MTTTIVLYALGALILMGAAGALALQIAPFLVGPLETWPISLRFFGLVLAVIIAVVAATVCLGLVFRHSRHGYELDRNMIAVLLPAARYIIPLDQIVNVSNGENGSTTKVTRRFGRGNAAQTLVVETQAHQYVLAVRKRDQFTHELEERRRLGVVQPQREGHQQLRQPWTAFLSAPIPKTIVILIVIANIGLWGLLTWRYPSLPETVPVRFDPVGGTAGTRSRTYTLLLPSVATLLGLGNVVLAMAVYRRTRLGSELLLVGALLVQLVLSAAISFVVTGSR
jgi:hypothetical protein